MRRALSITVVAAALAAVVPGVSQAAGPAAPRAGGLQWRPCPAAAASPRLQCSTLTVPLDYRKPHGRTIRIAISRLPSRNPAKRHGVLLVNPGGPDPGLNFPAELVDQFGVPQSVQDTYDLIGFDPRGIGRSTPVTCDLTPEQQAYGSIPVWARGPADVAKQAAQSRAVARQCATSRTAWMLPYITTANTARDMDRIRAALGEATISYDGYSYGTYLGAVYTTLFPRRSDRIVLDSNEGPGGPDSAGTRLFGRGVQDRFPDFAAYAAANDAKYGLGATPRQVTANYLAFAARLDRTPVHGVTGALFRLLTFTDLYGDAGFPKLAAGWQALKANRPLPPDGPPPPGPTSDPENLISDRYLVGCGDSRWPTSVATYQRNVAVDRVRHPIYGAAAADILPCAFWPDPVEPPVHIGDRGPSDVLMVQNLRDPATPLVGARATRDAFGARARMVTVDQGGHGVYVPNPKLPNQNQCANAVVTTYLTTGRRPAHDFTCPAQPR